MYREAREASHRFAEENGVSVEWRPLFRIEPRPFDPHLLALCEESVREVTGDAPAIVDEILAVLSPANHSP